MLVAINAPCIIVALVGAQCASVLVVEGRRRQDPLPNALPLLAGICFDSAAVVFNGKCLNDDALLSLAGVEEEATLNVLGRLLGGAKKRKKKTYTKPKKAKHVQKKIKLRVLKFYKVCLGCMLL